MEQSASPQESSESNGGTSSVPAAFMKKRQQDDAPAETSGVPAAFKKLAAGKNLPKPATNTELPQAQDGFGWAQAGGAWPGMQGGNNMWAQQGMTPQGFAGGGMMGQGFGAAGMNGMGTASMNGMNGMNGMSPMMGMFGGMQGMQGMQSMQGMQGMPSMPGMPGMPGMQGMPSMTGMPGMQGMPDMQAAQMPGMDGMQMQMQMPTFNPPGMENIAAMAGVMGASPLEAPAPQGDVNDEQAAAIHEAVAATQHAQYMQQVQFLQQMKAKATQEAQSGSRGVSRFVDDYRAFRLCRHYQEGTCWQGSRCVYAHCFEELHPASPDMPKEEGQETAAMAEMKPVEKEKEAAPNMRLRKKRELCKRFMDTGSCVRDKACPNAHGEAEIGQMAFVLYDKVKLSICNHWERGKCSYGDNCIHAHGDHEIGQKRREFFDMPPVKRRREGESVEEFRAQILRDPSAPCFPGGPPVLPI